MLSASAFARNKPRKRCPQLACPEMLLFGVQARRFRERDSFISNRSRLRNVFITRSLSRSNIRLTGILRTRKAAALSYAKDLDTAKPSRTGITPPTCRGRNSKSIVVPSRAGISPRKELQKEGLSRSIILSRRLTSLPFISRWAGKERIAATLPHPAAVSPCREEAVVIRHRARESGQ